MKVGFYAGMYDAQGVSYDLTRDELIDLLEAEAETIADPANKLATMALSTARYPDGVSRGKANAIDASAIALDVDEDWTLHEARAACDELMTPHVIYTTTKHTDAEHRFRIVLFLDRPVDAEEYEALWFGLAKRWGVKMDAKTRDISRISILPRAWTGTPHAIVATRTGVPLDVDAILKLYPRDPEPVEEAPRPIFFDPLASARANLRRLKNSRADVSKLLDLDDSPIIPARTLAECLSATSGGRTYKLLCSVAASAMRQGYPIEAHHLVEVSKAFSMRAGRRRITAAEHYNDAMNAHKWASRQGL